MTIYEYKFDFEIGNLVKSPCKDCKMYDQFPQCLSECASIEQIHEILAQTRSCSKNEGLIN